MIQKLKNKTFVNAIMQSDLKYEYNLYPSIVTYIIGNNPKSRKSLIDTLISGIQKEGNYIGSALSNKNNSYFFRCERDFKNFNLLLLDYYPDNEGDILSTPFGFNVPVRDIHMAIFTANDQDRMTSIEKMSNMDFVGDAEQMSHEDMVMQMIDIIHNSPI